MTVVQSALRPAFFRILLALTVVLSVGGAAEIASARPPDRETTSSHRPLTWAMAAPMALATS